MAKSCLKRSTLALACCFAAHTAHADFLGVYVGGGIWQSGLSGDVGVTDFTGDVEYTPASLDTLGLEDEQNTFLWAAFEHPVPVIPNIKLAMSDLTISGTGAVSEGVSFGGSNSIDVSATTDSEIDLGYIEATLYYEVLDNWLNLDIGLTARSYDGGATINWVSEDEITSGTIEESMSETLPMLYAKGQFDLPFSGFYGAAHINYVGYENNAISDIEAKLGYMTNGLVLDFGIELGYRQTRLTLEAEDALEADITADGLFLGVVSHF